MSAKIQSLYNPDVSRTEGCKEFYHTFRFDFNLTVDTCVFTLLMSSYNSMNELRYGYYDADYFAFCGSYTSLFIILCCDLRCIGYNISLVFTILLSRKLGKEDGVKSKKEEFL